MFARVYAPRSEHTLELWLFYQIYKKLSSQFIITGPVLFTEGAEVKLILGGGALLLRDR